MSWTKGGSWAGAGPVPLLRHPLRLWQRSQVPSGLRRDAQLRLADIAADRAGVPWVRPRTRRSATATPSADQWRRVAAGVAQGDGLALLALGRGVVAAGGQQFTEATDVGLTAWRLAHLAGDHDVRVVAAMELLLALPDLIVDPTTPTARRGRALAILHVIYGSLERSLRGSPSAPEVLSGVVVAWTQVAAATIERGLLDPASDYQEVTAVQGKLQAALAARAAADDQPVDPLVAAARRKAVPGRGRMVVEDEPPDDGSGDAGGTLVPHPAFDASRLSDNRTALAKRYEVLGTPLPLVAAPSRAAAEQALGQLAAEMPNFAGVLDRIADQLSLLRRLLGRPSLRLPPLLLLGPPGIGKTRLCRRLAESVGVPFGWLSLAGSSDSRELAGTARGWSSSHPAWPLEQLAQLRCGNPLLLLDEIDKAGGSDANGRAHDTMLTLLEPGTAARYSDECLGGPVDLSQISWVLTANTMDGLPAPLRSRLTVVEVAPPTLGQLGQVMRTILTDLAREHGLMDERLLPEIPAEVLDALRAAYARQPDPRRLRRGLAAALALAARHEERDAGLTARLH